jgi:DtxR family manganese transport transcriptional regulator
VAFLCSLGIPKRVAEMDAEGIEHHVSRETLAALKAALRDRKTRRRKSRDQRRTSRR